MRRTRGRQRPTPPGSLGAPALHRAIADGEQCGADARGCRPHRLRGSRVRGLLRPHPRADPGGARRGRAHRPRRAPFAGRVAHRLRGPRRGRGRNRSQISGPPLPGGPRAAGQRGRRGADRPRGRLPAPRRRTQPDRGAVRSGGPPLRVPQPRLRAAGCGSGRRRGPAPSTSCSRTRTPISSVSRSISSGSCTGEAIRSTISGAIRAASNSVT